MNHGRIAIVSLLMSGVLSFGALARLSEAATANGLAHFTFDDGSLRTVSFNATTQRDGTAVGNIDIHDRVPIPGQDVDGTGDPALAGSPTGVNLSARVECLVVKGTAAILGGQITRADVARYVGKYVLLFVEDRGGAQARVKWGFYEPDAVSCETAPRGAPRSWRSPEAASRFARSPDSPFFPTTCCCVQDGPAAPGQALTGRER